MTNLEELIIICGNQIVSPDFSKFNSLKVFQKCLLKGDQENIQTLDEIKRRYANQSDLVSNPASFSHHEEWLYYKGTLTSILDRFEGCTYAKTFFRLNTLEIVLAKNFSESSNEFEYCIVPKSYVSNDTKFTLFS